MRKIILVLILLVSVSGTLLAQEVSSVEKYIIEESIGGKLDFKKVLEADGKANTLIAFDGVAYSVESYAILLWGQSVKKIGIGSYKKAKSLWEKIYQKKLSKYQTKALKKGYKLKIQ
ncbi:hypothetical protein [Wenyingzhuangia sp. IMCC45574]